MALPLLLSLEKVWRDAEDGSDGGDNFLAFHVGRRFFELLSVLLLLLLSLLFLEKLLLSVN